MSREIDDIAKRKQYREEHFDGKRSTTDEYRGGRIFFGGGMPRIQNISIRQT